MILGLAHETQRVRGLVVGGTFGWSLKKYRRVTIPLHTVTSRIFRGINRYTNLRVRTMGSKMALGARTLTEDEKRQYILAFKERGTRSRPLSLFGSFLDSATQLELDRSLPAFRDKAVLIQFGDHDLAVRMHWHERWAEEIAKYRINILKGVAHFTFEGVPEATTRNFRKW